MDVATQKIGPRLRINWLPPSSTSSESKSALLYKPDSMSWLSELSEYFQVSGATWLVSSVQRDAMLVLKRAFENIGSSARDVRLVQVQHSDLPLQVNVSEPERVGIDRLLAAWAGATFLRQQSEFEHYAGTAIIIQAGSAVTVDEVLLTSGKPHTAEPLQVAFQGGAILPGIPLMLRMLGSGTDQLPVLSADQLTELPTLPGKTTEQAMLVGAASSLLGGVSHIVQRYRKIHSPEKSAERDQDPCETTEWNVPVILSGGDGMRISPHLSPPVFVHADLVLQGLNVLARQQGFAK